jgi:hypothetical protein
MANEYFSQEPKQYYGWQAYEGGDYWNQNQNFLDQKGSVEAGQPQGQGGAIPGKPGSQEAIRKSPYMDWSNEQWADWDAKMGAGGATEVYNSMVQESVGKKGGGPQVSVNAVEKLDKDTWRDGSPGDARRGADDGYSYGTTRQSSQGGGGRTTTHYGVGGQQKSELDLGDITLDLPEYKPPAEDEGVKKQAFEETYQRGKGDLQQSTHQAILATKSLDNPNARAQMMDAVLSSMGSGLNEVAKAAGNAANQEAARKRAEQLTIYNAQFQVESAEAQAEYDRDLTERMANYEAQQAQEAADAATKASEPGTKENGGDYVGTDTKREGGIDYRWAGPKAGWVRDY